MLKSLLIAGAILFVSPVIAFSQDLFWSFDSNSLQSTATQGTGTSGTAYLFSDGSLAFNAIDLNFSSSDSSVFLLTGGTTENDPFSTIGGTAFDSSALTIDTLGASGAPGASGNLFSVNITQNGINPAVNAMFNPAWRPGVGPNGAVLLAQVDYQAVNGGTATLDILGGDIGVIPFDPSFFPSFGSATLTVSVPEPSSVILLVLGSVGLAARRRRPLR